VGPKVLIVDDHADFRAAVGALLRRGGFDVVGEADTMAGALRAVDETHPDLVVLDVQLPDGDGIEGAAVIADGDSPPAVVLVSARPAAELGSRLTGACARGFIAKDELTLSDLRALL
jgi:DNA-binding NarL/FixJ family response regulator